MSAKWWAAVAAVGLVAVAGCGGSGDDAAADGTITLTVKTFSQFGYDELYKQYESTHPGIKIKEDNIAKLVDYTPKLQQWLTAGSGAGDVVALEEGILVKLMAKPDQFANLLDQGAGSLKGNFLEWKWNQALTTDGKKLVGLGTDIGAQGMCYRTDLFAKAGLPTDREQVGALWPTWDQYLATGKKFAGANTGASFFDTSGSIYQNILMQQGDTTYFDRSNNLIVDSNPGVRKAWDQTVSMVDAGLSGKLQMWSPAWNAGFKQGTFATIPCPAWMLGIIKDQAGPENAGKWDVARVPGEGAVRGGSFLAVPTQSKHQKEAAELVKFLTSPEGQTAAFKAKNNFPSAPQALDDPAVAGAVNEYFNNAPVGKIFAKSAKELKPVYLGPENQQVGEAVGDALTAVEQGKLKPDEAWSKAVADAQRAAGK
ncbi:extracellular solute-binding protein [Kribbella sandramycini]|uniref:Cellobiose transport system substrate-binding protein n=1 Tax=Kribbella sandramycini TaxID=60450 RepID=A0A7Y4NX80_9ACTN|nr:extracellular solute-binding protein [Kribbella sandramycini]MBB6568236.1 cellobiose transport system substrate-binding protein [Kribbella sandramycini]NOL39171.1 extracellular solute-binding protein [Kribbella sandramycini]